jgi:hypothetical protein
MNVADRVKNVLAASEAARNSDTELLIIYMQKSGMNLTPTQIETYRNMPSPETIRRTRQKIQEEGHFLPSAKVGRERKLRSYVMRQNIPGAKPDKVEKIIQAPQVQELLDWIN